jgi:hypothetical protein
MASPADGNPEAPVVAGTNGAQSSMRRRILFVVLALVVLGLAAAYVLRVRTSVQVVGGPAEVSLHSVPSGSLLFVNKVLDAFGVVAANRFGEPERTVSGLRCDRLHFANDHGVCLAANRGVLTTYWAVFFGKDLEPLQKVPLAGIPSRVRVAPDGKLAATTVFVSGHSYAPGQFSTETSLWRLEDGSRIATLEQFDVERDGKPFRNADFNFWGVTFANDGRRFFATLATGGTAYLIEGDLQARTAKVLLAGVECPSLSPDNRRIAFKRARPHGGWGIAVLELDTMKVTPLAAESRSVDDQVEWLNDREVLYALSDDPDSKTPGENIWALGIDGGAPRVYLARATSPARVP